MYSSRLLVVTPCTLAASALAQDASPSPTLEQVQEQVQLRKVAEDVEVASVEFTLPNEGQAAEDALSDRYFNKPQERRFSDVTTTGWEQTWDLFASVLVEKAREQKLDAASLEACLKTLNRGHTAETMGSVGIPGASIGPFGEKPEDEAKRLRADQAQYEAAIRYLKDHPEIAVCHDAAIPVIAHLAKHDGGSCWIIVCKWEVARPGMKMGHVRVWALDTVTQKAIAYVTCD